MSATQAGVRAYGNKADQVYDALRAEFMAGEWPFGKTFSTYELAERFGVSRRPVMDAALRLEADGFMEIIPQVGCRVVTPEEKQVREQFELAAALEGAAARLAATKAGPEDVKRLQDIHAASAAPVKARDPLAYAEVNREFHRAILEIARSGAIASAAVTNWDLRDFYLRRYRQEGRDAELPKRHAQHAAILKAIKRKEPEIARACMEEHLDPERGIALMRAIGDL